MPKVVWVLLAVGLVAFALAVGAAALLIASDSGTDDEVSETLTTGAPPPRLELPLADEPDALMLAERRGTILVGIAARPGGPVQVAVVDGEDAVPREEITFGLGGSNRATACGYACWELGGDARDLTVAVRGRSFVWSLPGDARDATALYARATRAMAALRSYRYDETLTSGVGRGTYSTFDVLPPDRMRFRTRDEFRSVLIADSRWDFRGGRWEESPFPGFRASFMWDGARGAKLLGERNGLAIVAAFDDDPVPAWFELHVDERSGRVVRADMLSPSHFMVQRFHSFNAPIRIEPPR